MCVFCLYVCCAATDPGDPGIFKSKKHLKVEDHREQILSEVSKHEGSTKELNIETTAEMQLDGNINSDATRGELHSESERLPGYTMTWMAAFLSCCGMSFMCNWCHSHEQSSEQQLSEEGMFYCSLCEVEVCQKLKTYQKIITYYIILPYRFFVINHVAIYSLDLLLKSCCFKIN